MIHTLQTSQPLKKECCLCQTNKPAEGFSKAQFKKADDKAHSRKCLVCAPTENTFYIHDKTSYIHGNTSCIYERTPPVYMQVNLDRTHSIFIYRSVHSQRQGRLERQKGRRRPTPISSHCSRPVPFVAPMEALLLLLLLV